MSTYTDQQILKAIQQGGKTRDEMTRYLLKQWRGYAITVGKKYHLNPEQQKDAFTDALVKVITQIDQQQFRGDSKISSYFFSILNNRCVDVLRSATSNKNKASEELNEWTKVETKAFELIGRKDELQQIRTVMNQMGESCKNILLDWGFEGYSMKEISERRDLASPETARSMKYKCLKKLKSLLIGKV